MVSLSDFTSISNQNDQIREEKDLLALMNHSWSTAAASHNLGAHLTFRDENDKCHQCHVNLVKIKYGSCHAALVKLVREAAPAFFQLLIEHIV